MKLITLIILSVIFIGCSNTTESPSPEYVEGDVVFGLQDSVSLEELADYVYTLDNISISDVVSFQYDSDLPQDSMETIQSVLEAQSYFRSGTVKTSWLETDSKILVEFCIQDFESEDRNDWALQTERFHLTHSPYKYQVGLFKVDKGKERDWIDVLSETLLFRYVELNTIGHITTAD
ncbi:MAG: hypothetical protein AB7W47_13395 [Calditrichaceae bacterium]